MSQNIPNLTHEAANRLNYISTIAGCLRDKINNTIDMSPNLKDELTKYLKTIETKVQDVAGDLGKIKEELNQRGQYT